MISSNLTVCPNCKSTNSILTDFSAGQIACSNCALVLDDRIIDESSEWRNFSCDNPGQNQNDPNRVGSAINIFLDESLNSTIIATKNNNSTLSKWRNRSLGGSNRSLQRGFRRLDELASKIGLANAIVDRSKDNLKKVEETKKLKGRSLDAAIAVIFFFACRESQASRGIKDIVQDLQLDRKEVNRTFSALKKILSVPETNGIKENITELVRKYGFNLEVEPVVIDVARQIVEKVCDAEIVVGRSPATIAATALYLTIKLLKKPSTTKKMISEISKVAENTINTSYSIYKENITKIVPLKYQRDIENVMGDKISEK